MGVQPKEVIAMKKLQSILLVDDDDTVNFFNEFLLKELQVSEDIVIRENGQEAIGYLTDIKDQPSEFPELIFLDINMPVMDGFEFLEAYREAHMQDKTNALIVMLTTSLHPKDVERANTYPFISEYVYKPLTKDKIQSIVTKYFPHQ